MKAINKRHFNPETMPYQETQIVSRYDYYTNKLSFGEKRIYKKPNGKQFKELNESLLKSFLNKFSNEDLYKAHNILTALRLERSK